MKAACSVKLIPLINFLLRSNNSDNAPPNDVEEHIDSSSPTSSQNNFLNGSTHCTYLEQLH